MRSDCDSKFGDRMLVLATQSSRNEQKWDKTKTPAVTEANENMQALLNS